MQVTTPVTPTSGQAPIGQPAELQSKPSQWSNYNIIRRNGAVVNFEPSKIGIAMTKAFLAVNGGQGAASARVRELVEQLTGQVVGSLVRSRPNGGTFHIEDIQDGRWALGSVSRVCRTVATPTWEATRDNGD